MKSRFGAKAQTVWFNTAFYGGLLLWTAVFLLLSPFLALWHSAVGRRSSALGLRLVIHSYGRVCCALMAALVPLKTVICAGAFAQPCILVANHQSFFDPYCMGLFPTGNLVFVVRSWPFRIPVYGRCMRKAGYLNVDELGADAFLETAGALLREGTTIVIFPEGTRSGSGRLGRFHSGAFTLAMRENVPVTPICIKGTGRVFAKQSRLGKIAPITVSALAPVYPGAFLHLGSSAALRLRQHVKAVIQRTLETA
jgi:1-acyl-sn-glycerol-3-phosphate acyltransferase